MQYHQLTQAISSKQNKKSQFKAINEYSNTTLEPILIHYNTQHNITEIVLKQGSQARNVTSASQRKASRVTSSICSTSVDLEMLGEVVRAREALVTCVTLVRLDSRVRPPVTQGIV